MIKIWLILLHTCHLPVVIRQFEVCVHCVCVDCELTGIWWRQQTTMLSFWWHQRCDWVMQQFLCCFVFMNVKNLHFLRPSGLNHRTPAGSTLRGGEGSDRRLSACTHSPTFSQRHFNGFSVLWGSCWIVFHSSKSITSNLGSTILLSTVLIVW